MVAPQFNEQFLEWLSGTPEMLARFLEVAKAWAENQGKVPEIPQSDTGPREFEIGGEVGIEFEGITNDDIDAIKKAYAEAIVKEKAFEYIRGFVAGIMLVAG